MIRMRSLALATGLALALGAGFSGLAEARGAGGGGAGAGGAMDAAASLGTIAAPPTHPGRGRSGAVGAREAVTACWFDLRVRQEVCERVTFYR